MSSSTALREYRVRVHVRGAVVADDSTVDFTLHVGSDAEVGTLFKVPIFGGQEVYPLEGRADRRPFTVEGVDVDGLLTSAFAIANRWAAIMRLVDCQYRDIDVAGSPLTDWFSYGTGRCSQFDSLDGEGKFRLEVSDESWKLKRKTRIFEFADTTQLWPAGHLFYWRGFAPAIKATGTTFDFPFGLGPDNVFFVKLLAAGFDGFEGSTQNTGVRITEKLRSWIRADLLPEEEWSQAGDAVITQGNFRHLRLNYEGHDYQILTFANPSDGPILQSIEEPETIDGGQGSWAVQIWAWCLIGSGDPEPPESGDAFLYAPTAEPTADLALHAGSQDSEHQFGTALGFIHFADFTQRILDDVGIVYDPDNLAAFIADKSFPAIAPRITESPDDPLAWLQKNIFAFQRVTHGRDGRGRFKLIDLRPKRVVVPGIPILDITNCRNHLWLLAGREQVNSVNYLLLRLRKPEIPTPSLRDFVLRGGVDDDPPEEDATLDNFIVKEETTDPEDGDTLEDAGRLLHTFDARAAAYTGYNDVGLFGAALGKLQVQLRILQSGAGSLFETYKAFNSAATLNTFQDGLYRGQAEVEGVLSETLEEGDEFYIDFDSLEIAFPGQIGGGIPGSAGPVTPGAESVATLDPAPTLGTPTLLSDLRIQVPVTSMPTDVARVEYASSSSNVTPPDSASHEWLTAGTRSSTGNVFTPVQPRGTYTWLRVSGEDSSGVRQTEYATPVSVEIPDWPHFESARLTSAGGGSFIATWDPSPLTLGVLVCWDIHLPSDEGGTPVCAHVEASELTFTIPDTVPIGSAISVTLTAYSGWDSDVVDGSPPGQVWPLNGIRRETLSDIAAVLPIDLSSDAEVENVLAPEHGGVPLGGTTGQVLKKQSNADLDADWEDDETGGGGGLNMAQAVRTAGNVSVGTTFAAVDTGIDLVLPAVAGDVIAVNINAIWDAAGATDKTFDVATMVSGSANSWFGNSAGFGAGGVGPAAWYTATSLIDGPKGTWYKTLVSGDISGGNVTLRVAARAGATRTLLAGTSYRFEWAARNLGQ